MSLTSGLLVLGMGLILLRQRFGHGHGHFGHHHHHGDHSHDHDHDHGTPTGLANIITTIMDHDHVHSHGHGHSHSHLPPASDGDKIRWRSLLALGVSGGLVPCPSALVVLLGAIALGRVGFGLLLVAVFSLGLAGALTGVGVLFLYARRFLERRTGDGQPGLIPGLTRQVVRYRANGLGPGGDGRGGGDCAPGTGGDEPHLARAPSHAASHTRRGPRPAVLPVYPSDEQGRGSMANSEPVVDRPSVASGHVGRTTESWRGRLC